MATATQPKTERFPSPFEVETPPGAEGWRNMYPPYVLFSDENREFEDNAFWIWDSMHLPEVQRALIVESLQGKRLEAY